MNKTVGISMLVIGIALCIIIVIRLIKTLALGQGGMHIAEPIGSGLILIALGAFLIKSGRNILNKK